MQLYSMYQRCCVPTEGNRSNTVWFVLKHVAALVFNLGLVWNLIALVDHQMVMSATSIPQINLTLPTEASYPDCGPGSDYPCLQLAPPPICDLPVVEPFITTVSTTSTTVTNLPRLLTTLTRRTYPPTEMPTTSTVPTVSFHTLITKIDSRSTWFLGMYWIDWFF